MSGMNKEEALRVKLRLQEGTVPGSLDAEELREKRDKLLSGNFRNEPKPEWHKDLLPCICEKERKKRKGHEILKQAKREMTGATKPKYPPPKAFIVYPPGCTPIGTSSERMVTPIRPIYLNEAIWPVCEHCGRVRKLEGEDLF